MTPSTITKPQVEVDPQVLQDGFAKHDFPLHHNLASHPLFSLDELAVLADSMPEGQVEHNLGDLPEALTGDAERPQADLTPGEIARGIESNGCWMVLKRVEHDPRYKELLHDVLGPIVDQVAAREGGATRMEGYIVLSAPNSTTPVHIDPEHNVFVHVRGPKRFVVGSWPSDEAKKAAMRRYYLEDSRWVDEMPEGANVYKLEPGDGLYLPPHAPHMVKTFDPVAISLSAAFYTKASEDLVSVYSMNKRLEKLKLPVAAPGEHPAADRAKARVWQGMRKAAQAVRRG